jgi:hypothetical protein
MSDSEDSNDQSNSAAAGSEHKGFLYKVKAFKRRTLHKVQKASSSDFIWANRKIHDFRIV